MGAPPPHGRIRCPRQAGAPLPAGAMLPIAPTLIASLSRRTWIALALIMAVLWFAQLDVRKLQHPDEGRYAEIAREMALTGDWTTPRLNGIKYFEKPPLQYWMTAAAYKAFGEHEWTARLWAAVTGFAGVLVVWIRRRKIIRTAGRILLGDRSGEQRPVRCNRSYQYARHGRHVLPDPRIARVPAGPARRHEDARNARVDAAGVDGDGLCFPEQRSDRPGPARSLPWLRTRSSIATRHS